jgi:hypothetical protein
MFVSMLSRCMYVVESFVILPFHAVANLLLEYLYQQGGFLEVVFSVCPANF